MEVQVAKKIDRIVVPELDEILGIPFQVLDKGFIRVIDYMGNDSAIVQAARVSYGKGTKKISEDRGLIRYLMRHSHTTPIEQCEIKLHVKVPMDTWRQWIRHRMASTNEYSTRYSIAIDDKQTTSPNEWRLQSKGNRQGSEERFIDSDIRRILSEQEAELHVHTKTVYENRIEHGIAREQARKDLPLSNYTEAYWKIDLHNLLHFLSLRMDSHAQQEIRDYAKIIGEQIVSKWCPLVWEAFNDYNFRRDALLLSGYDKVIIQCLVNGNPDSAINIAKGFGWLKIVNEGDKSGEIRDTTLMPNRERSEFESKLTLLGMEIPWKDQL